MRQAEEIRKISRSVPIVGMTADVVLGVQEDATKRHSSLYQQAFDPDLFIQTIKEHHYRTGRQ
jgi:hypothetical protein